MIQIRYAVYTSFAFLLGYMTGALLMIAFATRSVLSGFRK